MAIHYDIRTELEQKLDKTIEQTYVELPCSNGTDIPTTFDLEAGAQTVSVDEIIQYGKAALLSPRAKDIPLVKIDMTKSQAAVVMAVSAWSIDFQSERAFNFSGKRNLVEQRSVNAVRRSIEETLHFFAAYGSQDVGVTGLYNNANVTATVSTFNPNTGTFPEMLDFMLGIILSTVEGTRQTRVPNTVHVSPNLFNRLAQVNDPQDLKTSVLVALRARLDAAGYPNIQILRREESASSMLESYGVMSSGTNRDRVLVYYRDPDTLGRQVESVTPMMFPDAYTRTEGTEIIYPMFNCATETHVYERNAMRYIDLPKATA